VTGIFDVSDELFLSEISRPMLPETLRRQRAARRFQPEACRNPFPTPRLSTAH